VSDPRLLDYLTHIRTAIERIVRYTAGLDIEAFRLDERTQDAVIRNDLPDLAGRIRTVLDDGV
jgi:uncharacterized protein with HEPN domain